MASIQVVMDLGAELTLQIIRLVHERPDPPRSPAAWMFWPDGRRANWAQARDILAAAPKPILISPLIEPGHLGLWTLDNFEAPARERAKAEVANQVAYYDSKLASLGLGNDDYVQFETATPPLAIPVPALLTWAGQYALNLGVSIKASADKKVVRVILRPPGGEGPPLGVKPSPYEPAI